MYHKDYDPESYGMSDKDFQRPNEAALSYQSTICNPPSDERPGQGNSTRIGITKYSIDRRSKTSIVLISGVVVILITAIAAVLVVLLTRPSHSNHTIITTSTPSTSGPQYITKTVEEVSISTTILTVSSTTTKSETSTLTTSASSTSPSSSSSTSVSSSSSTSTIVASTNRIETVTITPSTSTSTASPTKTSSPLTTSFLTKTHTVDITISDSIKGSTSSTGTHASTPPSTRSSRKSHTSHSDPAWSTITITTSPPVCTDAHPLGVCTGGLIEATAAGTAGLNLAEWCGYMMGGREGPDLLKWHGLSTVMLSRCETPAVEPAFTWMSSVCNCYNAHTDQTSIMTASSSMT